ncbi:hypothetical protein AWZ03_014644, partial [Drosophila navojoa]
DTALHVQQRPDSARLNPVPVAVANKDYVERLNFAAAAQEPEQEQQQEQQQQQQQEQQQ